MNKRVVLASSNQGKLQELTEMLLPLALDLELVTNFDREPVAESGSTFVENAILKARHGCQVSGLPALADDSGLVVPVLDGAPGIYSARYAGSSATDRDNIQKLLGEIEGNNPHAYFRCVLVYLEHELDTSPLIAEGTWHGRIMSAPRGTFGFGYDPVFFDESENCTAAEMDTPRKNTLSHRGQAVTNFINLYRNHSASKRS